MDITDISATRMYETGPQVFSGLMKNAHEGMATPVGLPVWTVLLIGGHVLPPVMAVLAWMTVCNRRHLRLAIIAAALPWIMRFLTTAIFRQSWLGAVLHPFGVAVLVGLQWVGLLPMAVRQESKLEGAQHRLIAGQSAGAFLRSITLFRVATMLITNA